MKGVNWLGIGTENVVEVECDNEGRMMVKQLEEKIEEVTKEGKQPLIVVATAGTTVLGAFDPLTEIADVCSKYKIWLHLDVRHVKLYDTLHTDLRKIPKQGDTRWFNNNLVFDYKQQS